jgi:hypothetical protein
VKKWSSIALLGTSLMVCSPSSTQAQACASDANCASPLRCVSGICAALNDPGSTAPIPQPAPAAVDSVPPSAAPTTAQANAQAAPTPVYVTTVQPAPAPVHTRYVATDASEPPPSAARFFEHAYFSVGGMAAFSGAGGFEVTLEDDFSDAVGNSGDWELQLAHGLHMAAYFVPNRSFHIGLFFDRMEGRALAKPDDDEDFYDDFRQTNFGVAMKAGGGAGRAFVSFALDVGLASLALYDTQVQHGMWLHPRLQLDVMAVRDTPLKAAVYLAFGPAVMVVAGHTDIEDNLESLFWGVAPVLQLGGTFGG